MDIKIDDLDFLQLRLVSESGEFVNINLKEELSINESNLDQEMLQQPAKYVYWSSILEKVRLVKEQSDLELEQLMGELDKEARTTLPIEGTKPTKDSVENYIRRTQQYKEAIEKRNYWEHIVKRMQYIVKSLEQRKDMLQSYGKQLSSDKTYGHKAGRYQEKDNEFINNQN